MLKEILYDWGGANVRLFHVINHHAPGWIDSLMVLISGVGNYWNLPLIAIAWFVVALRLKRSGHAAAPQTELQFARLLLGAVIALLLTAGLKLLFDFPRPSEVFDSAAVRALSTEMHYSLPSGHAVFSSLLAATLWPLLKLRYRIVALLIVLAVGFSRIWLGAHFPADVVAGYVIGLTCALVAVSVTRNAAFFDNDSPARARPKIESKVAKPDVAVGRGKD